MGGDPTTFAGSDHGFAPQWYAVNANAVLNQATVGGVSLHASGGGTSNCSAVGGAPVASAHGARRDRRHRQGVLGRRDGADLHQPEPDQERRAADLGDVPDVRGGAHGDPQRVLEPHRPGEPGQAGHPQDHEQGGAAQRRRLRLAAPEPQRRRRRRLARRRTSGMRRRRTRRSRSRASSASTATCRTPST